MQEKDFSQGEIACTAFFTGHRNLSGDSIPLLSEKLYQCILLAYKAGYRRFLCGCARGFDMLAAFQTFRLREQYPDVIMSAVIPCAVQADRWNEKDSETYHMILSQADEKIVLSPVYYQGVMLARNRYMADRSSLCICYLVHMRGGTASAVRYALIHDRIRIVNLAAGDEYKTDLLREN